MKIDKDGVDVPFIMEVSAREPNRCMTNSKRQMFMRAMGSQKRSPLLSKTFV